MIFEIENYTSLKDAVEEFCAFLSTENIPEECVFNSKLVAYELLGNSLKHAKAKAWFWGSVIGETIEIKVLCEKDFVPPQKSVCSEVFSEHGRGFFLIDSLCAERLRTDDGGIIVRIKIK